MIRQTRHPSASTLPGMATNRRQGHSFTLRYDESLKAWLFVDETQGIDFRRLDRSRPLERGAWSSVVLKKQGTLYYVEVNSESIATFEGPDVQAATLRLCQFITPANVDRRTHVS